MYLLVLRKGAINVNLLNATNHVFYIYRVKDTETCDAWKRHGVQRVNPLTTTDGYIRQIWLFPQRIHVFYIYRSVKDMEKFDA
jgi:hypothetical protein